MLPARHAARTCGDAAYPAGVEWLLGAVLAVAAGAVIGWLAHGRLHSRAHTPAPTTCDRGVVAAPAAGEITDAGVPEVLAVLGHIAIVVDANDGVVMHSPTAVPLGLVRDADLAHASMREVVRGVRRDGVIRELELEVPRGPLGEGLLALDVRVAPLGASHVLVLVEDRTRARRVEEVRRDFVANISHELKTPVGGISLLAEAIVDAADDPETVARFAGRIGTESRRLGTLVHEIVELSRLQSQEAGTQTTLVDVADVAREAIGHARTIAEARDMTFVASLEPHTCVYGDPALLGTAILNLLTNAVNYSPRHTRVAVTVRTRGFVVEVAVADQGRGIPAADLDRIFERFYRVDPARSRATGGTGLGLAIVKHVCANHGGEVTVWSSEGIGSTFTIRLPTAAHGPLPDHRHDRDERSDPDDPADPDDASAAPRPAGLPSATAVTPTPTPVGPPTPSGVASARLTHPFER